MNPRVLMAVGLKVLLVGPSYQFIRGGRLFEHALGVRDAVGDASGPTDIVNPAGLRVEARGEDWPVN